MKRAIFAGSFDPPTLGHMDIITRSASVVDELVVAIGKNTSKRTPHFSVEERKEILEELCQDLSHVKVLEFQGLVVDFAKELGVGLLLRGVRAFSDFEYEFRMALANRQMSGIETVFLMAEAAYAHISSTLIREIDACGGNLDCFVPTQVVEAMAKRCEK